MKINDTEWQKILNTINKIKQSFDRRNELVIFKEGQDMFIVTEIDHEGDSVTIMYNNEELIIDRDCELKSINDILDNINIFRKKTWIF